MPVPLKTIVGLALIGMGMFIACSGESYILRFDGFSPDFEGNPVTELKDHTKGTINFSCGKNNAMRLDIVINVFRHVHFEFYNGTCAESIEEMDEEGEMSYSITLQNDFGKQHVMYQGHFTRDGYRFDYELEPERVTTSASQPSNYKSPTHPTTPVNVDYATQRPYAQTELDRTTQMIGGTITLKQ